jgi:hypothetical protein
LPILVHQGIILSYRFAITLRGYLDGDPPAEIGSAHQRDVRTARQPCGGRTKRGNELRELDRNQLGSERFALPAERKEPLTDASHVRNAIARFDQVEGVSDAERDRAWRRIRAAAKRHGVEIEARGWRQLMAGKKS